MACTHLVLFDFFPLKTLCFCVIFLASAPILPKEKGESLVSRIRIPTIVQMNSWVKYFLPCLLICHVCHGVFVQLL